MLAPPSDSRPSRRNPLAPVAPLEERGEKGRRGRLAVGARHTGEHELSAGIARAGRAAVSARARAGVRDASPGDGRGVPAQGRPRDDCDGSAGNALQERARGRRALPPRIATNRSPGSTCASRARHRRLAASAAPAGRFRHPGEPREDPSGFKGRRGLGARLLRGRRRRARPTGRRGQVAESTVSPGVTQPRPGAGRLRVGTNPAPGAGQGTSMRAKSARACRAGQSYRASEPPHAAAGGRGGSRRGRRRNRTGADSTAPRRHRDDARRISRGAAMPRTVWREPLARERRA